jgi:glycosyltransferase involved in cell wall biosynthesis
MRILHLTRTTVETTPGGLEHHVAYLTRALRQRGHEVEVLPIDRSVRARRPSMERNAGPGEMVVEKSNSFAATRLGTSLSGGLDTVLTLCRRMCLDLENGTIAARVAGFEPDVIHQHAYLGGLTLSWCLARRYPIIFTNHTGAYLYLNRYWPTRQAQRGLLNLFDEIIAPSRELLPKTEHSHYVPNGVDSEVFFPVSPDERKRLREQLGCQDRVLFICPRRWAPTKGIVHFGRALRLLSARARARSTFLFAGNDTPGYENYQRSVRSVLGAAAGVDVRILGNLKHDRVAELMNAADVCVIPSLMEATSLACLEAMACGTPVLGSATGGLLELIEEGLNGWLVPPAKPARLAAALERIVGLDALAQEPLRAGALATIRGQYRWDLIAARTEQIYLRAQSAAGQAGVRLRGRRRAIATQ